MISVQWSFELNNLSPYNEVLRITNNLHRQALLQCMERNLDTDDSIFLVPWHFVKSRFHCSYN